jgi:non-heme chloroperoxidase
LRRPGDFAKSREATARAIVAAGARGSRRAGWRRRQAVEGQALDELKVTYFEGVDVRLVADVAGPADGAPVMFLHGGGQTRASWKRAVTVVAARGYRAISLDLRGHGDSGWAPDGDYRLERMAEDLEAVAKVLSGPAVYVGASMGGLTALLAIGECGLPASGLVLVDVAPQLEPAGSEKIGAFMRGNPNGFASLDEAADAVAAYLPHRPRPKDTSGLMKNLRVRDGRLHWHWDPQFIEGRAFGRSIESPRLEEAASRLKIPTLLIRGGLSQVVSPEGARAFLALAPHAEFVDVSGADHMVAGDDNDAFNTAVVDFISRHVPS